MQTDRLTRFNMQAEKNFAKKATEYHSLRKEKYSTGASISGRHHEDIRRCHAERLLGNWEALLFDLGSLGTVEVETRNRGAVFQFTGCYDQFLPETSRNRCRPTRSGRSLRFFLGNWRHGLALQESDQTGSTRSSLRFFDFQGTLVHAISLTRESNCESFKALVRKLAAAKNPEPGFNPGLRRPKQPAFHQAFDVNEFRNRWLALTDRHDQSGLTKQVGISELQGLRLIGDTWAIEVPVIAIVERLHILVQIQLPFRLALANAGTLQIRSGKTARVALQNGQLNLSGDDWCLSITLSEIDSAWVVTKPAAGRLENSIELYNRDGEAITRIQGTSEPLENGVWQDLLGTLPTIA
ncbi:MAG: hypothetical protein L0Y43_03080 [Methylococcaceae bacterium]|nr:hypothetical protein [Methylococcaceae bacterium]